MRNALSGLRLVLPIVMGFAFACVLATAIAAQAQEPTAAGLWQKVEKGKPVGWFLVVDHDGIFEGAIRQDFFSRPAIRPIRFARNAPTIARMRRGSGSPSSAT